MGAPSLLFPEANSISFHNPQLAGRRSQWKNLQKPPQHGKECRFILIRRTKNYHPRMSARWIHLDVCKIQIQRDEDAFFFLAMIKQDVVLAPGKRLFTDRLCVVASCPQGFSTFDW